MANNRSLFSKITASREATLVIILVVLLVIVNIVSDGSFLTGSNISQIFRNNALTFVMAVGMLCVLLTGGIDISITSILAFSGMSIGLLQKYDITHSTPLLFIIAIGIGLGCGTLNGIIIAKGKITPIICTLGFMYIWRGFAYVISNNNWASATDVTGYSDFGKEGAIGPYIIIAIVYVSFFILMKWTKFGRRFYAVGSNMEAAKVSGINTDKVIIPAYGIMGVLSGLAGALSVAIYASAQPNMQYGKEMDVIAACVIGGVSMNGGRGTVLGAFLGALFYAIVAKALPLVGLESIWQNLIKGVIILVVVLVNIITQRALDKANLEKREI